MQVIRSLYNFETPSEWKAAKSRSVHVTELDHKNSRAVQIQFDHAEWPAFVLPFESAQDWSMAGGLAIDISNPGNHPFAFGMRIDSAPNSTGTSNCQTAFASIGAGKSGTFVIPLNAPEPMSVGMRGLPFINVPGTETVSLQQVKNFDPKTVYSWQVFMQSPYLLPANLIVDNLRLVTWPAVNLNGIVDQFGQYSERDWPGKLKRQEEFSERLTAEWAQLREIPRPLERDRFGGWAAGPKLAPSQNFRTTKLNGQWWLVDPDGHLFFSIGLAETGTNSNTMITGREYMYQWLPPKDGEFKSAWGTRSGVFSGPVKQGDTFNFYGANLVRKFGADYKTEWRRMVYERFRSWGLNTFAAWSDEEFLGKSEVPYTVTSSTGNTKHARVPSGADYWGRMHDPFDPIFTAAVNQAIIDKSKIVRDDPWCLGYFFGNEESWGNGASKNATPRARYGLAYGALSLEAAASPAKRAFIAQLKAKYAEIGRFNAAWGTNFADWAALDAPYKVTEAPSPGVIEDLSAFVSAFADQYFQTVRSSIREHAPGMLYLGCRFSEWGWTPEVVQSAAKHCDVVSFNIYKGILDSSWDFLKDLNVPVMVGEFQSGAFDRGMFHQGLYPAANQTARGEMFRDYVESAMDHPNFVGCHWFRFADQALTGRSFDGENHNTGFVDVTDTPYPELVNAAREVSAELYKRRYGR